MCVWWYTRPVVGLRDPVLSQRVECVTTCCCFVPRRGPQFVEGGLVRARTRVGVGAWDRGGVETASLCGYCRAWKHTHTHTLKCFATILPPHWFADLPQKTHKSEQCNNLHRELLIFEWTCMRDNRCHFGKNTKYRDREHNIGQYRWNSSKLTVLIHMSLIVCTLWFLWLFTSNSLQIHTKSSLVGREQHCVLSAGWMQSSSCTQKKHCFIAFHS